MKLIIISQYYAPDHSATGQILHELASSMARLGDEVHVITGQPSYAVRDRLPSREIHNGVYVQRVFGTSFDKNKRAGKILNSITFFLSALWASAWTPRSTPLLIVSNPPFLALVGWILCILKRQPYVYLVHDVYPDIAVQLGYLKAGSIFTRIWESLNSCIYATTAGLIVLSESMRNIVLTKPNVRQNRIWVIHNWADGNAIVPFPKKDNPFAIENELVSPFVVQYSGNMGLFHDLEGLIAVSKRTHDLPIRFLLIGDGGKRKRLQLMAEGSENVTFLSYRTKSELPLSLTACDVAIVTLESGIEGLAAPSKLYGIMAAGRAVVAIVEEHSYIRQILRDADCGIAVLPKDIDALEKAIRSLASDPQRVKQMGQNSRKWFDAHFSLQKAVHAYRQALIVACELPEDQHLHDERTTSSCTLASTIEQQTGPESIQLPALSDDNPNGKAHKR